MKNISNIENIKSLTPVPLAKGRGEQLPSREEDGYRNSLPLGRVREGLLFRVAER